jgi:hypothetical protein
MSSDKLTVKKYLSIHGSSGSLKDFALVSFQ